MHAAQNPRLLSLSPDMNCTLPSALHLPTLQERITGAMEGIALGDALGLPVETKTAQEIKEGFGAITKLLPINSNPYFPIAGAGFTSDDTQLSFAVMEGILLGNGLNLETIAQKHVEALHTSTSGWGGTTRRAVAKLAQGISLQLSGYPETSKDGMGNGVVMKLAPVAMFLHACGRSLESAEDLLIAFTAMTHRTSIAAQASFAHTAALLYCLRHSKETFSAEEFMTEVSAWSERGRKFFAETQSADDLTLSLRKLPQHLSSPEKECHALYGGGSPYVYHSLPYSYLFFLRDPYSAQSIFSTVNAGGDTDSNASMVGALLGALHGPTIFPRELITEVRGIELLQKKAADFTAFLEDLKRSPIP